MAFAATQTGLYKIEFGAKYTSPATITLSIAAGTDCEKSNVPTPMTAVAVVASEGAAAGSTTAAAGSGSNMVAAGNSVRVWLLTLAGDVVRWDWVTDVVSGAGGVYDNAVRSMAFDAETADLYVGNDIALNVRSGGGGGVSRIDGTHGLPYANITSIVTSIRDPTPPAPATSSTSRLPSVQLAKQVWLGTDAGIVVRTTRVHPPTPAPTLAHAPAAAAAGTASVDWKYLYGPRWHPGKRVSTLIADGGARVDGTVFAATDGGVVWLEQQLWTLQDKAAALQEALVRHSRHGLVSECGLPSFGNVTAPNCLDGKGQVDDDNNGLWTSLVVGAEYFRYRVTGSAEAATSAAAYLAGMQRLHNITGIPGLYARSLCGPVAEEPQCATIRKTQVDGPCGVVPANHGPQPPCPKGCTRCGLQWRNSSNPLYKGWVWKSDTSSDESAGHFFAFSIAARLAPTARERAAAAATLVQMVDYLVDEGGLCLKDWTGAPTTWGRWSPRYVNGDRAFSDERGLQSLQLLAFMNAAINATDGNPPLAWTKTLAGLTNKTTQYLQNLNNLKIQAPCDDNYSDDELTFLPFYTLISSIPPPSPSIGASPVADRASRGAASSSRRSSSSLHGDAGGDVRAATREAAVKALAQTYDLVRA